MSRRTPLQRVGAIKLKLGALLVGGVVALVGVLIAADAAGLPPWLAVAIAVGIAMLVIDLLGSGLTGPLVQMARQADRLASGHPVEPVDDQARDEVGALARAFNRMAREVAHTDRVRRDLVANVSHELRTPLAALSAVLENVADGVQPADTATVATMQAQSDRLRRLVEQLLDLSQLDAGAVTLDRGPVPLAALVDEVVAGLTHAGGSRIVVDVPEGMLVQVDRDRFAQVLVNLAGNALRHGPPDTPVTVTARDEGGRLRLTVEDRGPGIAPADAARVFDRFARADEGRAGDAGGSGLGLAITRWIVELHDGSIDVERPGEPGARLTLEIPMDTITPPPPPAVPPAGPPPVRAGAPLPPPGPPSAGEGPRWLPTPVTGLSRRSLVAAVVAAVLVALVVPLVPQADTPLNTGVALALLAGAAAVLVAAERPLDTYAKVCCAIAVAIAAMWAVTSTAWALVPVTLGAVLLAGLGLWGPRSFGEHLRALVVGPFLMLAAPVAIARVSRERDSERTRVLVPLVITGMVLLVFGGLLAGVDGVFSQMVDAVLPDIRIDGTLVLRIILGVLTGLVVVTYVLAQRAGTVVTTPWRKPVRPVLDWALPVGALDALFAAFVLVQVRVLFGGDAFVQQTTGLTYAEHARTGFGQLLLVAVLTLGVIGAVTRVADEAHRRTRDLLLGTLVGLTLVMLASAVQRLVLYVDAFGLTRLRVAGLVVLVFVALMLLLVAAAGRSEAVATHLPRVAVVVAGVLALGLVIGRPDVVIASVNLQRYAETGDLDTWYLAGLSHDATPTIIDAGLTDEQLAEVFEGCWPLTAAPGEAQAIAARARPSVMGTSLAERRAIEARWAKGCW